LKIRTLWPETLSPEKAPSYKFNSRSSRRCLIRQVGIVHVVFPLFPYCSYSISTVSTLSLCQLVSTTFCLACRNLYSSLFARYCPITSLYQDVYRQQRAQDPQPVRDAIARFADSCDLLEFPGAHGTDPVLRDASGVRHRSGWLCSPFGGTAEAFPH
jgi:hypothetical protein